MAKCGEKKGIPKFPCKQISPSILAPPGPIAQPEAAESFAEKQAGPDTAETPPPSKLSMYSPGPWVDESVYDADRVPIGCTYEHGRITRVNKNSTRPPHIPPEVWETFSRKQKQRAKEKHAEAQEETDEKKTAVPSQATKPPPVLVGTGGSTSRDSLRQAQAAPKMAPKMPCCAFSGPQWKHREKIADVYGMRGLATVARPVKAQEIRSKPAAQAAMDKIMGISTCIERVGREKCARMERRTKRGKGQERKKSCGYDLWFLRRKRQRITRRQPAEEV